MYKMIFKWLILPCLILFFGIKFDIFYTTCKILLINKEILSLFSTLIAGLFGFIVAIVPIAIHIFNQNTKFIVKITEKDNFNFYIKPLFFRFIAFLKGMFYLFIFLLLISFLQEDLFLNTIKKLDIYVFYFNVVRGVVVILSYFYILLIINFMHKIWMIIKDLQSLISIFLKLKNKD